MLDFMERYSYGDRNYQDFVHFNSTIKVGEYDVGDLSNLAAAPQHTLSNDDYMIISEVGDHFTDDVGNFGTQLRKLIIADLSDSAKFNVLGTTTKEEVVNLYHDIVDTDVRESFDRVEKHFPEVLPKDFTTEQLDAYNSKIKELSNRLINEANDRNLGSEAIYALETYKDKDGIERFNIPLFDPIQASRTEALLGSLYRNNVVKQRINGGNLVMVSSVGLSETLEIKWNADKTAVEYLEVYAPHWWAQELEGIIDPTTGIVDMNKITDKSILDIIGYRIPTEDKYSMLPLRIKAFLPRSSGGIIILPQEITTLSGADFDIDKLYVMFPNFRTVRNWDFDKLTQEVKELGYAVNKEYIKKLVLDSYKDDTVFTDRDLEIYDTINLLPDAVVDRISKPIEIRKIKYNANKTPKENSKKARDNAKMDIIRAVLTNPDVTDKLLDPGNFEYITTLSKEIKRKKDYSANLDILDPTTDSKMFEAAMAAAGLIGVFANQNINHAIFQHGDVNLSEPIQFGNKIYSSLSRVYAEDVDMNNVPEELKNSAIFEPKRISRKLSMFLSAIVDDLKHLNSGPLNINFFTADVLSTMMRLGEDMNIALAFINQPSIIRLQELNQKYGDTFDGFKKAMDDVKKEYNNIDTTNDAALTLENLWDAIGKKGAQSNDFDVLQITALNKFEKLRDVSFDLGRWVRAFRSDNIKRKVNLASNEVFERNVDKALKQTTFIGADTLWNNYPMLKAFYDTAVTGASETLNRFFLYNSPLFTGIKDKISANLVGRKELAENNIANVNFEIMSALINQFDFFQGDLLMQDGKTTVREHILNNFPKELEQFMIDNPKFKAGYKILRQLKRFEKGAGIAIDTLRFRNTGTLTDVDKAEISESWKQLLYYKESDNMEFNDKVRKLGEDLVKYSFFAYGFHQTSDSFSQYIPLEWRKRLRTADGTITFNEFLESLFDMSKNDMVFQGLYEQFKQHYAANRFFVQRWEAKTTEELNKAIESGKLKLDKAGNPVELNLHINSDEVMVLEKRSTYGVGNEGRFPDYVAIDYKDRIYLFRANGVNGMGSETEFTRLQSYEVIPTLGVKRFAKEYTPNALNKKSVFDFNNVSTEPTVFKPVVETTEQATTQQAPALETTTESSTFVKPDDISQESWDKLNNEQKQRLIDCG
jgi:Sec-independent protein translocase protein TatA